MVKRTGPTNYWVRRLISTFEKYAKEKRIFKKLAEELSKPTRQKKGVNLWKIEKFSKEGEVIVVPRKVLGKGKVSKKIVLFALDYSKRARDLLEEAGVSYYYLDKLPEFLKENQKLQVKIIK